MTERAASHRPEFGGPTAADQIPLRAGPLQMIFDHGDLRYIRCGEKEVIRRIHAAIRDQNWSTIPARLSNLRLDSGRDFFHISYDSEHTQREISFLWHAEISGDADGTIRFTFDGEARSTFLKNRIGLCVLLPIRECAGQPCKVEDVDGTFRDATFPRLVAPEQPVKDIHDLRAISCLIGPGRWTDLRFEGDIFEMEDQRNWIDASYKIFSTPLRLPYPVEIKIGTRIRQSVALTLNGPERRANPVAVNTDAPVEIVIDIAQSSPLPPIGSGVSSFRERYNDRTIALLKALRLSHLRADLCLDHSDWQHALAHAEFEANALGLPLEIALTLSPQSAPQLDTLRGWALKNPALIKRWMVFTAGAKSTTREIADQARTHLRDFGPIGVGTNADFYQLNQSRPPWQEADFVCWSMNPQVHAFDDLSLAETAAAIPSQFESARTYFPGKPLVVSPVTLKPRFNPVATASTSIDPTQLPAPVDPRQATLLGAGWTLSALSQLLPASAESLTLFETVGWRGVIERLQGSPHPVQFSSTPSGPFPLYFVLRWINEFSAGNVIRSQSSRGDTVASLVLRKGQALRVLVANLTPDRQRVSLAVPMSARLAQSWNLDAQNVTLAPRDPETFLKVCPKLSLGLGGIGLSAHEIVCMDFEFSK